MPAIECCAATFQLKNIEGNPMAKKQTQPTFETFDFTSMLQNFKMPGVDIDGLMAAQQKNIDAINAANRATWEGMQSLAQRQSEVLQATMAAATASLQSLSDVKSPEELTKKQAEMMRTAFEQALGNMREMADMLTASNKEAFAVMSQRVESGMEELKQMMDKAKG
jgi:phasin family protein